MREDKAIAAIIEKLEALKKAEEEYQSDVADQIKEELLLDLVDVENCIAEHSRPEDGLGGNFFPPTGAFTRDLMRDVRYAIKSQNHVDTNTLIRQFKIVQKRVKKSAGAEQVATSDKKNSKSRKIFGETFNLWGLEINYKNLWHKIKSVARTIKNPRSKSGC